MPEPTIGETLKLQVTWRVKSWSRLAFWCSHLLHKNESLNQSSESWPANHSVHAGGRQQGAGTEGGKSRWWWMECHNRGVRNGKGRGKTLEVSITLHAPLWKTGRVSLRSYQKGTSFKNFDLSRGSLPYVFCVQVLFGQFDITFSWWKSRIMKKRATWANKQ